MKHTRIARFLLAGGIVPALAITAAAGMPALPGLTAVPAIPAGQPGAVDGHCSTVPDGFSPWTRLYSEQAAGSAVMPSYEITVDPWHPCRMYRARSVQAVDRSTDGGRTWHAVFADSTAAFAASAMHATASGALVLGENGNGDAALSGGDGGAHWSLMDGGLEGQQVRDLVLAPGFQPLRSGTAYALAYPSACAALPAQIIGSADCAAGAPSPAAAHPAVLATADGGQSWTATTVPALPDVRTGSALLDCSAACPQPMQLRLDPSDPGHLWLLVHLPGADRVPGSVGTPVAALFESHDRGTTYSLVTTFSSDVAQLLVAVGVGGALRLYVVSPLSNPQVSYSDNDGTSSFTPVSLPPVGSPRLGMDPADNGRLALAGVLSTVTAGVSARVAVAFTTTDAFASVTGPAVLPGLVAPSLDLHTPLDRSPFGATSDAARVIQADTSGSFYISVDEACSGGACGSLMARQSLWRLHPGGGQQALPPARCLVSCGSSPTTPPAVQQELLSCAIPAAHRSMDGPLAFDGRMLLYTSGIESGPGPDQGVIDELDPATCADAGRIVVDFDPQELDSVRSAARCPDLPPLIGQMTYDQRRNVIWATLRSSDGGDRSCDGALFQVAVTSRSSNGHAVARLAPYAQECNQALAYDYTDDSFWSCAHLAAADGHAISTCVPNPQTYAYGSPDEIATWAVAPPELYIWLEDDRRIVEYSSAICRTDAVINHRTFSEPNENEQMACDPLTFGPGTSSVTGLLGAAIAPTTVLWVRDAAANVISSFAISAGVCPLPTAVRLDGSAEVGVGQAAQLCLGLSQRYPGGTVPRVGDIALSYSGRADGGMPVTGVVPLAARTDAAGAPVCLSWLQSLPPGRYTVAARFGGTAQLLPSAATWPLRVLPPVQPGRPPSLVPSLLLPPPAPGAGPQPLSQPQPLPQAQPGVQAQVQVQSELQAQAQSQSVAQVQPGVMAQRQRQLRVATEAAGTQRSAAAMLAMRSRVAAVGEGLAAAVLLVGGRLLQPAWCEMRRRRVARPRRNG